MAVNYAARRAVKRGAQFLDIVAPGWMGRINRRTLQLHNSEHCICGQVFRKQGRITGQSGFGFVEDNLLSQGSAWLLVFSFPTDIDSEYFGFTSADDFGMADLQSEWERYLDAHHYSLPASA